MTVSESFLDDRPAAAQERYGSLVKDAPQASVTRFTCVKCREAIGGVVYVGRNAWYERNQWCESCANRSGDQPVRPCAVCGVSMALIPFAHRWNAAHICSEECQRERELRRRRVRHEPTSCEGCGAPFTPTRADGRYCSNACRQRAYRQRRGRPSS